MTRGCAGLREMNAADGFCDRCEFDREVLPGEGVMARQRQMGYWPGSAGGAEHAMFAMRGRSRMVVVRPLRGAVDGVRSHRVRGQ